MIFFRHTIPESILNLYVNFPRKHSNGLKVYIPTHESARADSVLIFRILFCYKHFLFLPPFWSDLSISFSWIKWLIKQEMSPEPVAMLEWNVFCQVHIHRAGSRMFNSKAKMLNAIGIVKIFKCPHDLHLEVYNFRKQLWVSRDLNDKTSFFASTSILETHLGRSVPGNFHVSFQWLSRLPPRFTHQCQQYINTIKRSTTRWEISKYWQIWGYLIIFRCWTQECKPAM